MKTLQKRMIVAVFLSIFGVFIILYSLVSFSLNFYYRNQAEKMVDLIVNNDGVVPDSVDYDDQSNDFTQNFYIKLEIDEESPYRTRYFLVHYDEDGQISEGEFDHIAAVNKKNAMKLAQTALKKQEKNGYIDGYYYSVVKETKETSDDTEDTKIEEDSGSIDDGGVIIFLNCAKEQTLCKTVLRITAIISVLMCGMVTLVFTLISSRIIRPFVENNRKQKQFITDASHELKTPLAIISANADVLRYKEGGNNWLDNISNQTTQMNKLIGDLLSLTKADEMSDEFVKEKVNLTPLIHEIWNSFAETAESKNLTMKIEIPENLWIRGNREMLERLFSVLTENATKYTNENGEISLTAKTTKRYVRITMFNTADLSEDFDCSHLFDRFYRPDTSRTSSTGGHGIGLSIARKIVNNHKGKITAECDKRGISFRITLPK